MYIFSLTMLFALRWARRTYPMDDAPLVYFVLSSETGGVDSGTWRSILRNVVLPALATCAASFAVIALANMAAKQGAAGAGDRHTLPYPMLGIKANLALLFYTALIMALKLKAWRYLSIWVRVHKKSVYSKEWEALYADPTKAVISGGSRRNVIIIFMESMESTFGTLGLAPKLTELSKEGISFGKSTMQKTEGVDGTDSAGIIGGGLNLDGTSWTVAGIISKLSGLPYFNPFAGHGKDRTALRNAVTLGDILKGAGYSCVFSMGSEKRFEGRDGFLEVHGFDVHDIDWYKAQGMIDKDYKVFWGFEDKKLFDIAREETQRLSENGPFCYAMLTVDTHFPDGYRCPLCPVGKGKQIADVVRCADNQVYDFVSWCKTMPWYKDTAIVIMGDHNYLGAPLNDFVRDALKKTGNKTERKWLDVFINAQCKAGTRGEDRKFSSYDMFPTILEAAGFDIEGGALAFGRSLFKDKDTLVESIGEKALSSALMQRTVQYEELKC